MGSLVQNNSTLSLTERLKRKRSRPALFLDRSGSMDDIIEPSRTKMDALKDIVKSLEGSFDIWWFDSYCARVSQDEVQNLHPRGGTWLSPPIKAAKAAGHKEAVVITDGDVNLEDQERTLLESEGITLKIIYVGLEENKPKFLEDLAKKTGGFCSKEDLTLTKELSEKVQGLLGPVEGGSIKL